MRIHLKKFVAMMLTVILLTCMFPTMIMASAATDVTFAGSFSKGSYTMVLGETLSVKVNASVTNANLTRVTVSVDGSGIERLASADVSDMSWSGYIPQDSSVYPLNTLGTYTIKLFASADVGDSNWAELDQATLIVTEPENSIDDSFGKNSYIMELDEIFEDHGVEQSDVKTVEWYQKAAEQGDSMAQYMLGWRLQNGCGVEQNDEEAVRLYQLAAEQGNADAQFSLGWSYHNGRGVEQNATKAAEWYQKAAEQGNTDAKEAIEQLQNK